MNPTRLNQPPSDTPPLFNSSTYPPLEGAPSISQDADATIKNSWPEKEEFNPRSWQDIDSQSDENQTVWFDGMLPFAAGGLGQFQAGNVPSVPGTPQIGGVPSVQGSPQIGNGPGVQGTPHVGGNPPPMHELAHQAPSSAPQHIWTREDYPTPPHRPGHQQQHPPLHHSAPPEQHPPTKKLRGRHRHESSEHERAEHQHAKTHQTHNPRLGRAHKTGGTTASRAVTGVVAKWAIVLLAAIVVMASGGIIFVLASSPSLSLSGNNTVSAGGVLQIHGRGFVPGGTITLTIDHGLPVALGGLRSTRVASMGEGPGAANLGAVLYSEQAQNSNGNIVVGITGTFDANVIAQSSWSAGKNTLHAKESPGSRSADLPFTLFAQPAHLVINPSTLDFGAIPQGSKVAESILIGNTGGLPLNWSATTDGSPWLSLQNSNGILQPNGAQDALYALVDTGKLKQGTYTGKILIHSNGDDAQIAVHMRIGPPVATKQAQLNVNPSSLDFGQLTPGQRVSNTVTIGNRGTLALQWQSNTSGAGWLSLSVSSGSVQPGSVPQSFQVAVDTSNNSLQAGSNTASITVHSNGGDVTIPVTLTLLSQGNTPTPPPSPSPTLSPSPTSVPSPSPTLSPTPSPTPTPSIQVTPSSLDPTSSNCSQNSDGTFTCAVTVGETSPGNLNWFAPTGIGGTSVLFNPSSGQLSPGQAQQQVTISSIPCAPSSFTFVDQNNNSATVTWSCTPVTPSLTITPATINANTDCSYNSSGWTCSSILSNPSSNQATANWAISGATSGMTFTPSGGPLAPGNSVQITVFLPAITCPANIAMNVTGSNGPLGNNLTCAAPNLIASPSSLASGSPCIFDSTTSSYTCVETVQEDPASQGNLAWSVGSTMSGVSYTQSSGTLSPGLSTQVTITGIPCVVSGSFTFSGGANAMNVPWLCGS